MTSAAERYVWGTVVPLAALALAVVLSLPAMWLPSITLADTSAFLPNRWWFVRPEPLEQLRYLLAVSVIPALLWWAAVRAPRRELRPTSPAAFQVLLVLFVVAAVAYGEARVAALFGPAAGIAVVGYYLLAALLLRWGPSWRWTDGAAAPRAGRWAPRVLAAVLAFTYLLPSIYREGMPRIDLHVWLHLPVQLGEPAAVWAGLTPLVDYVPQYQVLISYLMLPLCRVFGPTVLTLTTSAAFLSFVGLMVVYGVFRRLTANGWLALLLLLPFVGLSFKELHPQAGPERLSAFTYFAVGPFRLLGPWLTLGASSIFLQRPSARRRVLVVFVGVLAALNNLDFGLPALVGALVATALCETGTLRVSAARIRVLVGTITVAATAAILLLATVTYARAGRWPDLGQLTFYQRAYAWGGYMMLPLPPFGFHRVLYVTHMAAIAQGLFGSPEARLRNGLLLFAGIFGAGATGYYVGRSHPEVLILVLSPWALSLSLLVFAAAEDTRQAIRVRGVATPAFHVTTALLGAAWLLGIWQLHDVPNPRVQVARIRDWSPTNGPRARRPDSVQGSARGGRRDRLPLRARAGAPGERS